MLIRRLLFKSEFVTVTYSTVPLPDTEQADTNDLRSQQAEVTELLLRALKVSKAT